MSHRAAHTIVLMATAKQMPARTYTHHGDGAFVNCSSQ